MPTSRTGPLAAFFALGVFWGAWGAVMPAVGACVAGGNLTLDNAMLQDVLRRKL